MQLESTTMQFYFYRCRPTFRTFAAVGDLVPVTMVPMLASIVDKLQLIFCTV